MIETFTDILARRVSSSPDEGAFTFLADDGAPAAFTWSEVARRVDAVAARLRGLGLAGGRAILVYPPGPDFVFAFLGCLQAGVAAIPAYPPEPERLEATLPRLAAIAADARPGAFLTTAWFLDLGRALAGMAPPLAAAPWASTDDAPAAPHDRAPAAPDDLAFIQYTSGSTGAPRGVLVTHGNLIHNSIRIQRAYRHSVDSRGVIWAPPYHDLGLIGGILQPLFVGFPVTLMSPLAMLRDPMAWLRAISATRATTSGGPNFAYELCLRRATPAAIAELDLSSWRLAFLAAEPTRAATLERFAERFAPCGFRREAFFHCYGLAESTLYVSGGWVGEGASVRGVDPRALELGVARASDDPGARLLVSAGAVAPEQVLRVVDPETRLPVADGVVGEIWVSGPSVARGYWEQPEATRETFGATLADGEGPFLRTGDLGYLADDQLWITGRRKDLIIVRGRNLAPHDLEEALEGCHPALRRGCVAAFGADLDDQERVVIAAEVLPTHAPAAGAALDAADPIVAAIRSTLSERLGVTPGAILLLPRGELPKTSSGKIRRGPCRAAWLDGSLPVLAAWRDGVTAPVYRDLAAACATLDERSLRYRYDLERDIPWDRAHEPGPLFSDRWLAALQVDREALDRSPGALDLLHWALAIAVCDSFIAAEEHVLAFTEDAAPEMTRGRSVALLEEEEHKHIAMFQRFRAILVDRRPADAARLAELARAAAPRAPWRQAHARPVGQHLLAWLHALFFEEYTIHFHRQATADADIQATWRAIHAAHAREETQHVLTDVAHVRSVAVSDPERCALSATFLGQVAEDLMRLAGLDAVHALVAERHPAVGRFMLRTSLLREDPALARRLTIQMLREPSFRHTRASLPTFDALAAAADAADAAPAEGDVAGPPASPEVAARASDIVAWALGWCERELGVDGAHLDPAEPITRHGLDSVAVVDLAAGLTQHLGEPVSPTDVWRHPSFERLARHLAGRAAGRTAASSASGPILTYERLIDAARARLGGRDLALDGCEEALHVLLGSLRDEAGLSPARAWRTLEALVDEIGVRVAHRDLRATHREIDQVPLRAPVFITGLPRSGTTLLHNLLATQPGLRAPPLWALRRPVPTADVDRRDDAAAWLDGFYARAPGFRAVHPMSADAPDECNWLTRLGFRSLIHAFHARVPSYARWLVATDAADAYRDYRRWLQVVRWQHPGGRLVLKDPCHLWHLDAVLDVFPDATIVQLHRSPAESVASLASLCHTLHGLDADPVDPRVTGAWALELAHAGLRAAADARRPGARFIDVAYERLVADPVAALAEVTAQIGVAAAPDRARAWLEAHPADAHGQHVYARATFGLEDLAGGGRTEIG